ncbi:MAG: hypothetical protein ACXVPQ_09975 [Bacteroidia bacterium]
MQSYIKYFLLLVVMSLALLTRAQEVRVSAVLDSNKIRIGEQTKLDIYVQYNSGAHKNLRIDWPSFEDTITGKVEIVSKSAIDSTIPDKNDPAVIQQHQQFIITAFDSGSFIIPAFKFVINGDTVHPLLTETSLLEVNTVATDTTDATLKDIKPPFEEPFNWKWYLPYAYWSAGVIALVAILIYIIYRFTRKKPEVFVPEKPKVPPHITALAELERIRVESVWKEGHTKEYYSAISDAVRMYIEGRFGVNALELTTDEIVKAFKSQVVDPISKEKLQQLLVLSDFVKFAKQIPIEQEHAFTLQNAIDFVNGTKREEEMIIQEPASNLQAPNNQATNNQTPDNKQ